MAEPAPERPLPAWSLPAGTAESLALPTEWPGRVTRVGVGRVDRQRREGLHPRQRIEADHPDVGELAGAVAVEVGEGDEISVVDDVEGDLCGHGTACAGIVRSIAKDCELYSVRVLGADSPAAGRRSSAAFAGRSNTAST